MKSPLGALLGEAEQINPAIILADELMRRDVAELLSVEEIARAEKVLEIGSREIETIDRHSKAFLKCPATSVHYIPHGF